MASLVPEPSPSRRCSKCHVLKPISSFQARARNSKGGRKGEPTDKCSACMTLEATRRAARAATAPKRKRASSREEPDEPSDENLHLPETPLTAFLDNLVIGIQQPAFKMTARVDCRGQVDGNDPQQNARTIAEIIGRRTQMRWIHHKTRARTRTADQYVQFCCAQSKDREHDTKVPKDSEKARSTLRMQRYDCNGWLRVIAAPGSTVLLVSVQHDIIHSAYVDIELPQKWKDFVKSHAAEQTPGQLWRHIVMAETAGKDASEISIPFTNKSVYYYWHTISEHHWQLDSDPLESARKFIIAGELEHHVALLDVAAEPNTEVIAFQITDFVREWAANTQELGMDSTWNTNGANFELFAAVAGAGGSGLPLAYLLIKTSPGVARYAKRTVLERFLGALKDLGVHPEFTLTDKDFSEIGAFRKVWPHAKHQLCLWHALRAIKQRLARTKVTPAFYDVNAAKAEFSYISTTFVPAAQQSAGEKVPPPPPKPIPRVRLLINGRPLVVTPAIPTIRIPALHIRNSLMARLSAREQLPEIEDFDLLGPQDGDNDGLDEPDELWAGPGDDEWEWGYDDDSGDNDLRRDVNDLASAEDSDDNSDEDELDAPEHGAKSQDADYTFCPPEHRPSVMRIYAKHSSQHSKLPDRHGETRTAADIRRDAVEEMYRHCEVNNLCEVWAYLWTSWYSPTRWPLWARAANEASIPARRTTMMVEALWRNLKRLVLHLYNRPPVDFTVFTLITRSIPPYRLNLAKILQSRGGGRPDQLTHMQAALKRSWMRLAKATINGAYTTDIVHWTCDCGAQKYHAYLLCKHLVQKAGRMPDSWWRSVVRYHVPPFYVIPVDGCAGDAPESLTNYGWLERMGLQPPQDSHRSDEHQSGPSQIISSPVKQARGDGLLRTRAGDGAGFELDDEFEQELRRFISVLRFGADELETQLNLASSTPDHRFLQRGYDSGAGFRKWVQNVKHYQNRRTIPVTNTAGSSSVIGYQYSNPSST